MFDFVLWEIKREGGHRQSYLSHVKYEGMEDGGVTIDQIECIYVSIYCGGTMGKEGGEEGGGISPGCCMFPGYVWSEANECANESECVRMGRSMSDCECMLVID